MALCAERVTLGGACATTVAVAGTSSHAEHRMSESDRAGPGVGDAAEVEDFGYLLPPGFDCLPEAALEADSKFFVASEAL